MKVIKFTSWISDTTAWKHARSVDVIKKRHFPIASIFGFTLTELVVVITILAILGTIGFIGIQGYSARARDSVRITDMSTLLKGLSVWKAQADTYPIPENAISILAGNGSIISYQGYFGDVASRQIHMDKTVIDPKDHVKYAYTIDVLKKKVQIIGYMESWEGLQLMTLLDPVNIAYAAIDYVNRHIYVMGDQIGVLTTADNAPIQDTYMGTWVNLGAIDTTGMTAYFGGTAYGAGKSTGTGDILISQMLGAVNGTIPCNPMTYSGYVITALSHNETKSFTKSLSIAQWTGTGTLQIQCLNGDLDTSHATENTSVSCFAGYINTGNNLCVADVCSGSTPANSEVLVGTTQTISQNWTKGTGVAGVCTFECKINYTWNPGTSTCIANTQTAPSCNGSVAANATSNATATSWTQTWNGSTWLPVYTFTQNTTPGICTYVCNTGYTWNSGSQICSQNTYTVSGTFGANAAGQSVSVCGASVTADGSGNFSRANVPHGTVCNNVSASRAGYTCTTSVNGPASLTSAVSNISGSCLDQTAPTISSVTASSPACATVRVTINGASDTVALHATPYSFDGGSTWQAWVYKDYSGTSYTVNANLIRVRDAIWNIYTYVSVVSGSAASCVVNCSYTTYQWGSCSASCGGGNYGLYYTKTVVESGGGTCSISEGQFASWGGSSCNTQACPVNGVCNNTVQYACSAGSSTLNSAGSCGGSSTWTCAGLNGGGNASCSKTNAACPVNGGWSGWNYWYSANYGCNNYTYDYYIRYCNNPAPANGGASCTGGDTTYNTYYNWACCVANMGNSCIAYDSGWTDSSQQKFAWVWCTPGPYWVTYSSCPDSNPESYCTVGCGYHVYGTIQCNWSCQ